MGSGLASRPLPGILMAKGLESNPDAWVHANWLWRPTSVISGRAALRMQRQPELAVTTVDAVLPYTFPDRGLLRFHQARLPGELCIDMGRGLAATPAAACLLLGTQSDWEPICGALFTGNATVEEIAVARGLLIRRPDSAAMARTLRYVSENPWSVPELELHELLRLVGISGWHGNPPVLLDVHESGRPAIKKRFPDIGFDAEKLSVEVAGQMYHNSAEQFAADTLRARWFAASGWTQMPVTPNQLRRTPNDFLNDLCSRLHRPHRPAHLPAVRYQPTAPFWSLVTGARTLSGGPVPATRLP